MYDVLDFSQIRRIIFKMRWHGGQIIGLARSVAEAARAEGLISQVPDFAYSSSSTDPLAERILSVCWELVLEGLYTPGGSIQHPSIAFLRLTRYGQECFDAGELTPHDPDDYLKRLRSLCPVMDSTTLLYVEEALGTFRVGRFLSTVVMIGVAAESLWIRLAESVKMALDTPVKQQSFEKETRGAKIKRLHDEVLKRLRQASTMLPPDLDSKITQHLHGIADLTRQTRNTAGHPTGRLLNRQESFALLLLFPTYCETVCRLMAWLKTNRV
jgi:hypothetical protein